MTPCFTGRVLDRIRNRILGGSDGNEQLTAIVATLLLLLLAVEGATLLNMRSLLTVHAFVGVLLIPVVAVKLGSTGWRMLRYYLGADEYVRRGPPHLLLRAIVAPVLVASTIVLFGSGVGLLVLGQREGALVGLHKASFLVWFGATTVHVLTRVLRLPRAIRLPSPRLRTPSLHRRCVARHGARARDRLPACGRPLTGQRLRAHRRRRALDREIRPNRICRIHV